MFHLGKRQEDVKNIFQILKWHCGEREKEVFCYPRAMHTQPGSVQQSSEELLENLHTWTSSRKIDLNGVG